MRIRLLKLQQRWPRALVVDHNVHTPIVVEVAKGAAPPRTGSLKNLPRKRGDIVKVPVAAIAIQHQRLTIRGVCMNSRQLRIHMPVAVQRIQMAVIVRIKKATAPPNVVRPPVQPRSRCLIGKDGLAIVVEQIRRFVRKVRFEQVQPAIIIVVTRRHPHAGFFHTLTAVRHTAQCSLFAKRAITIVHQQLARRGVTRNVDIWPAIVIKVPH